MKEVVRIAPVQNDPGLIAYECPACGYLTSVLIDRQPDDGGEASASGFDTLLAGSDDGE